MKAAGIVLLILGIIGTIVFGIQAINQSESVSFLGLDIGVSSANWTPLIVSAVVLIIGIIMTSSAKKSSSWAGRYSNISICFYRIVECRVM